MVTPLSECSDSGGFPHRLLIAAVSLSHSLPFSLSFSPSLCLSLRLKPSLFPSLSLSFSPSPSPSLFLVALPLRPTAGCPPPSAGCRLRFSSSRASFLFLVSSYFSLISLELSRRPSVFLCHTPDRPPPRCTVLLQCRTRTRTSPSSMIPRPSRLVLLHARPRDRCLSHERSIRIWSPSLGLLALTSLSLREEEQGVLAALASRGTISAPRVSRHR